MAMQTPTRPRFLYRISCGHSSNRGGAGHSDCDQRRDSHQNHAWPIDIRVIAKSADYADSGQLSQSTPYLRTAHSVARFEIASCVGDDLSAGRMIRCFDAYDLGYKVSVILVHELDEFVLR